MRSLRKNRESGSVDIRPDLLSRLRDNTAGTTIAMMGMALIPIAAMIGAGLDISRSYMAHSKMQNACDAAALAARRTMVGNIFNDDVEREGERFFNFNFPENTMSAENLSLDIRQSNRDASIVEVEASAEIPVTVMALFNYDTVEIGVECDANQDFGNNDIMVVLDVTGSMNENASGGGGRKIDRLRTGARGLYRALEGIPNTRTRYGFMPYSTNVNVAQDLRPRDIRRDHYYYRYDFGSRRWELITRHIDDTDWADSTPARGIENWQRDGVTCIDERSDFGTTPPSDNGSTSIVRVDTGVTRQDIDAIASDDDDYELQWGRFGFVESNVNNKPCPAPARRLREYNSQNSYNNAVSGTTADVGGNTYHDIGMIWGARYLSGSGMFGGDNPDTFNGVPVRRHIIFMTDGIIQPHTSIYSAYGVGQLENRITGSGNLTARHSARFLSACNTAKGMGMTIWVIALDVEAVDAIRPCATSTGHFFTSDGSDLEQVFESIGAGIGRLRLTQ